MVFSTSWKMVSGEMVLAPHPRNTRIVHTLIQISHLLSHSSEKRLKNVITGTRKSTGPSGCKQGRAGPPLSAAGGYYIGSAERQIVPLHDKVGRAEIVLCILGCKFLAEVSRHCFTAAQDTSSSLISYCMTKFLSFLCHYYSKLLILMK